MHGWSPRVGTPWRNSARDPACDCPIAGGPTGETGVSVANGRGSRWEPSLVVNQARIRGGSRRIAAHGFDNNNENRREGSESTGSALCTAVSRKG